MRHTAIAVSLSLLVLTGCQAPLALHQLKQPIFALGQVGGTERAGVVTAGQAVANGTLVVSLSHAMAGLQARRVLAAFADVHHIEVTVTIAGTTTTKTVDKAALTNGQSTVTFTDLPLGQATVTVAAFDATGASLGSISKTAEVVKGATTPVNIALQLAPSNAPTGGGTGSAPSTGGLSANVSVIDGAVLHAPLPASTETFTVGNAMDRSINTIAVSQDGHVWVGGWGMITPSGGGWVKELSSSGQVLHAWEFQSTVYSMAVDATGQVWILEANDPAGTVSKLKSDGTRVQLPYNAMLSNDQLVMTTSGDVFASSIMGQRLLPVSSPTAFNFVDLSSGQYFALAPLPDGNMVATGTAFRVVTPAGVIVSTVSVPDFVPGSVAADAVGNFWAIGQASPSGGAKLVSPSGEVLATLPDIKPSQLALYDFQRMAIANDGDVWITNRDELYRVSSTGHVKTTYQTPNTCLGVTVGSSGVWMFNSGMTVTHLAP